MKRKKQDPGRVRRTSRWSSRSRVLRATSRGLAGGRQREGEQFHPDHELVRRYGTYYFTDAATPSWELAQMRTRRHHGHHPQ